LHDIGLSRIESVFFTASTALLAVLLTFGRSAISITLGLLVVGAVVVGTIFGIIIIIIETFIGVTVAG
jgi:hypothetical protein